MYYNPANIHIYKKDTEEEYYEVFMPPLGMVGTIHSFDLKEDGIITMLKFWPKKYEVRKAFTEYKGK